MKTTTLYASLTIPQRIRAMVSAYGRADVEELDRLAESSPDGCYSVPKVELHCRQLAHLAAIHNSLLLAPCTVWLFGQLFSPEEACSLEGREREWIETSRTESLEDAASIEAAFTARLTAVGISASDWQAYRERILDRGANELLKAFMAKAAGRDNPALVAQYEEAIAGYLFKADA